LNDIVVHHGFFWDNNKGDYLGELVKVDGSSQLNFPRVRQNMRMKVFASFFGGNTCCYSKVIRAGTHNKPGS